MHHGGNTVAHGSFVAPVRETRKEQGWRRQSGLVCGFYCCCKNSQCTLRQRPRTSGTPWPAPTVDGVP